MSEFDEKLNALLSNPERMAEIMQLAQSFSSPPAETGTSAQAATEAAGPTQAASPTQAERPMAASQPTASQARQTETGGQGEGTATPDFSALFSSLAGGFSGLGGTGGAGGLDPKLLARLLPLALEFGKAENGETRALLNALRPFLKPERQEKVDRALSLARLVHIGKKFLAGWEG